MQARLGGGFPPRHPLAGCLDELPEGFDATQVARQGSRAVGLPRRLQFYQLLSLGGSASFSFNKVTK